MPGSKARLKAVLQTREFLRSCFPAANTVRNSEAGESVARQREPGKGSQPFLNLRHAFKMSQMILRHRTLPPCDFSEQRFVANSKQVAQIVFYSAQQIFI